jgi:DNA polymerase-1
MSDPIFLFDIAAYLHRAMYVVYGDTAATTPTTDDKFIAHACGMLANTMEKLDVKRMAVVRDSIVPSLRCAEYPAYKAERKAHYPVFAAQAPRFFEALKDVSVAVIERDAYEADDLIVTLLGQEAGARYVVVSSDKDLLGCLAFENVGYHDPMKGADVTRETFVERFGIQPRQLYDYLGLVGDTADGIPGVPGFGAKTAAKLLRDFNTLDEVYDPARVQALAEVVSKGQLAKLLAHQDVALLSRRLARPWIAKGLVLTGDGLDAPSPGIVRRACG